MKRLLASAALLFPLLTAANPADDALAKYFAALTADISNHCLTDVHTKDDWLTHRPEYHRQLAEMLGLYPEPDRPPLNIVITGKLDQPEYTVEKIQFQSRAGLYVTADLYVPKNHDRPLPAILYVCGHSQMKKDGVSFGNKTAYQHHADWFARNGYVCLVPDTLQLGEIEGIHHGLYREKMWWWLSRGYTPAGVEVWNAMRCLDYLQSRPEVDPQRLGMSGRSGGGAYTWYTAALDERVKVAVPVAGMTDLQNQVTDGALEGHCDCMFTVNKYRWDFPLVAALIAPRPLLIGNTDKDPLFPLDGVERLYAKTAGIYKLYREEKNVGLLITEGPHADTQELQVPAFRWFNRFLKDDTAPLRDATTHAPFEPAQLSVFPPRELPKDQLNTTIHELFVPAAPRIKAPRTAEEWAKQRDAWMAGLRSQSFAGWPAEAPAIELRETYRRVFTGGSLVAQNFFSQEDVPLCLYVARSESSKTIDSIELEILDDADTEMKLSSFSTPPADNIAKAWIAPRGLGLNAWTGDEKKLTHIQRRFWLLGQTADGMRVWDIRRAIVAARAATHSDRAAVTLKAHGRMAGCAIYASLFESNIAALDLAALPASDRSGPDLLNVLKVLDTPASVAMAAERCEVRIKDSAPSSWAFTVSCAQNFKWLENLKIEKP